MLLAAAVILIVFAALLRSLRNGFYAAHVALVLGCFWLKEGNAALFADPTPAGFKTFLILHLTFINLLTFAAYGYDKKAALAGRWRVPEKTLHSMSLIGGTLGASIAQKYFRHKTKKSSFRLVFGLTLGLQLTLLMVLAALA